MPTYERRIMPKKKLFIKFSEKLLRLNIFFDNIPYPAIVKFANNASKKIII